DGNYQFTADAVINVPAASGGGGGLTAQQVRDAMKLAPSAGAPAAGSIDKHLDDIESTVDAIGAGEVTVVSPLDSSVDPPSVSIVRGDNYEGDRALVWTNADGT